MEENRSGIVIFAYDSKWKSEFLTLKQIIESVLKDLIIDIEHVGSTSIEGLGAKPILDIDIVIEDYSKLPEIIACLEELGYFHQEDWSFQGREAICLNLYCLLTVKLGFLSTTNDATLISRPSKKAPT